jgi:guanylate kinase
VSATTRQPRVGEREGIEYYFLSDDMFDELIATDGLLEWAHVHGARYGTLKSQAFAALAEGLDVVLEIDTQGALQVKSAYPEAVLVFVKPPSLSELRRRLESRGTEGPRAIEQRLQTAEAELALAAGYDLVIVNDDLERAAEELLGFILAGRVSAGSPG